MWWVCRVRCQSPTYHTAATPSTRGAAEGEDTVGTESTQMTVVEDVDRTQKGEKERKERDGSIRTEPTQVLYLLVWQLR